VRAGSLFVHQPGAVHDGIYGSNFSVVCIGIPTGRFGRYRDRIPSVKPGRARRTWHIFRASASVRTSLMEHFNEAAHTLRHDEAFRVSRTAVESMLDDLTAGFVNALRDAVPSEEEPALRDGAAIVRRAEEAIMNEGEQALRLDALCRTTGVARRSLSRAFQLILGIGPATYLRHYRLNEARRALVHGGHGGTTVTEVADRFGFHHLGRFSSQYHAMFGETPSVTRSTSAGRQAFASGLESGQRLWEAGAGSGIRTHKGQRPRGF
jgi:AraC family ethanolamine operon transcriptional activator